MTADPSIAIGSQPATVEDMASAYGVFAADGIRHPEVFVTRVTDRNGRVLYEAHPAPKQVLADRRRPHRHRRAPAGGATRHRHQRPHRPARRGQDRERRGQHRRLVRRVHARARRRGLGRRAAVEPHRDATAAHPDHRARRHVPGAGLAGLRVERARDDPGVDLPGARWAARRPRPPAPAARPPARSRPASTRWSACTCSPRSSR